MKTIREIAEIIGVSKTAVRKRLTALALMEQTQKDEKGVVFVPETIADAVIASFGNRTENTTETPQQPQETPEMQQGKPPATDNSLFLAMLEALTAQLDAKDRQIEALNAANQQQQETINRLQETVSTVTAALTNAQALHAGTIQQQLAADQQRSTEGSAQSGDENGETVATSQDQPEIVTEDTKEPQTPADVTERPRTSGKNEDRETVTPLQEAPQRPTAASQSAPKHSVKKEQPRKKGLLSIFRR